MKIKLYTVLFFLCSVVYKNASAQYVVKGTVFDSSRHYTIEAVTVQSTSGKITMTDTVGRYKIDAGAKDSIWFSYLGKPTPKYAVAKMADPLQFDISLQLKSNVMREVRVRSRIYKEDSIQNRKDYAKVFNFSRPNLESLTSVTSSGVGFDLQELIRVFQFRKNRSMERFRERLLQQERDKFVDHRFTKGLVKYLTGLDGEQLDQFMKTYRPSYAFTAYTSDYEFQLYIKKTGEEFKGNKSF